MSLSVVDKFNGSTPSTPATMTSHHRLLRGAVPRPRRTHRRLDLRDEHDSRRADPRAPPVEGLRAIWQLGPVEVLDGGADGSASTTPNTPFLRQGIFVP